MTFSTSANYQESLTIEKLKEIIDSLYPPLYYGADPNIERGAIYLCKETDMNPEFIVVHPDDLEKVREKIKSRKLVYIKDEPAKDRVLRMYKLLKMTSPFIVDWV